MRYLCLVYLPEEQREAFSAGECEELLRGGPFVEAFALQQETATTMRIRNGRLAITAGPLAETAEQLGGLVVIEARDLNEAIRLAARLPPARLGSIEVRPIKSLS